MTLLVAVAGGFIFRAFEKNSQHLTEWDAIYWALTTMTTLGSQYEPHTVGSQLTTIGVLLVGVSFMAMLTGAIAQRFLNPPAETEQPDEQLQLSVQSVSLNSEKLNSHGPERGNMHRNIAGNRHS